MYAPQSVAILKGLPKPADTIRVFPRAGHFLLDTPHGLNSEISGAHRFRLPPGDRRLAAPSTDLASRRTCAA